MRNSVLTGAHALLNQPVLYCIVIFIKNASYWICGTSVEVFYWNDAVHVIVQGVHSPLPLLNSKNLFSQNKTDLIQLNWLHCLSKMWSWEAIWKTINIKQQFFHSPNEYLLMLIKNNYEEMV
jgi:hypothetical protein